jgi:pimeloyl-ACP methyl ester carboxylesterase
LAGHDADVRLYTTPIEMDEVREALGYAKLNLYGVSYGTTTGHARAAR